MFINDIVKGHSEESQQRIIQMTHGTDTFSSSTFHLHALPRKFSVITVMGCVMLVLGLGGGSMVTLHNKRPYGVARALCPMATPTSRLSMFFSVGRRVGVGSVAVGLVWVLWRLLGGRGVSHAALGQWCAWSWVLVGSMWIWTLQQR